LWEIFRAKPEKFQLYKKFWKDGREQFIMDFFLMYFWLFTTNRIFLFLIGQLYLIFFEANVNGIGGRNDPSLVCTYE
jgi:hypothetical protein